MVDDILNLLSSHVESQLCHRNHSFSMLLEPRRRSSSVTIGVINRQRLTTDEIHGVHKTPSTSRSWKRSEEIGQHIKRRLEFDVVIDLEGEKIPPSRHVVNIMSASTTPACLVLISLSTRYDLRSKKENDRGY